MSLKISRNAPCPCGSGKKYKKCCLAKDEENARQTRADEPDAGGEVARALSWLSERYHVESLDALEQDYYGSLSEEARAAIEELPEDLYEMQRINAFEWLVAEGSLTPVDEEERAAPIRFVDLVLSENGPLLAAEDREHLRRLGETPLRLYEIVEVEPGNGLWLADALSAGAGAEAGEIFVLERSGSRTLRRGDAIGARVLPGEPAVLSGALYPFCPEEFLALRRALLTGPGGGRRRKRAPEPGFVSETIIQRWLETLVRPAPSLVDAATGDPILLTTLHYRVRDWAAVEAALEADPLTEPAGESAWTRFESASASTDEPRRILWTLSRKPKRKEERLEVFARTARHADEAASWLAKHAGDALETIAREHSDPAHVMKDRRSRARAHTREPASSPLDSMSPSEAAEFHQKLQEHFYRNWHNEPIPALGNKTPKQAMRSESGRSDVVQLLKSYETQEERSAEAEGRPKVDYGFLWERLGLSRKKNSS